MDEKTTAIGIRIPDVLLAEVKEKAKRRKVSFNAWINWAVKQGLRKHRKA